jgi:serine protease Do
MGKWMVLVVMAAAFAPVHAQEAGRGAEEKAAGRPLTLRGLSASLEELSDKVRPAVVQIFSTSYTPVQSDSDSTGNSGPISRQRASGSGVVVSAGGYILTNAHVVLTARRIRVRFAATPEELGQLHSVIKPEGSIMDAKLVGLDRETDLALIRVERTGLPFLPFGNSDELRQGQLVLAFGNPFGLEGSVSLGVVSSTARQIKPDAPMVYIQTDAPINPGNSGGPLVDDRGRIVGINTFILTQSGGSEGIGFAVPSNIAASIYRQVLKDGHVHRGQIGISAQTITPTLAEGLHLKAMWGVLVRDVTPGGPADEAGLEVGDVINTMNGKAMENARQFEVDLYRYALNDTVKLEVTRGDQKRSVDVTVQERVDDPLRFADLVNPEDNLIPKLGILGVDIDKRLLALLPDLRKPYGVLVAARATGDEATGLETGDVIYSVNNVPIRGIEGLRKMLEDMKPGDTPVLQIEREGDLSFITPELE